MTVYIPIRYVAYEGYKVLAVKATESEAWAVIDRDKQHHSGADVSYGVADYVVGEEKELMLNSKFDVQYK